MDEKSEIIRIGITGGIGSGKSIVCKFFEEIGEKVLYADSIAKEITDSDNDIKNQIKLIFGKKVFDSNGNINRKLLGEIVFKDENLRNKLNQIIHPQVFLKINKISYAHFRETKKNLIFIESALIYETNFDNQLDYVIVIDADERIRYERLKSRDDLNEVQIKNRINSQLPAEDIKKRADFVIQNNGNIESLKLKVLFLRDLLLTIVKSKLF